MLRCRLILEDYGPDIEYIQDIKNIVAYAPSRFPINSNQETTQKSTYKKEILSEINDTEEIPEGIFPINLKLIHHYQQKEPGLLAKYTIMAYHKGSFRGGSNINLSLTMCEVTIVIALILQRYVLHWYYTYLLHP